MGSIDVIDTVIPALDRPKTLFVYLPDGLAAGERRPVLYMHDGHNLFDPATAAYGCSWNVHLTLDLLATAGAKVPIVVGIDGNSPKRFDEYSPWVNDRIDLFKPRFGTVRAGGEGDRYVDWIADVLKPAIESRYPADPATAYMAGSSMGGLISLYAACRRPETFRKVGAFSPAVWFAERELLACLAAAYPRAVGAYVDIGTAETSDSANPDFPRIYLEGARAVRAALTTRHVRNLRYVEAEGALHHEAAWETRFPEFVRWLLDKR